MRQSRILTDSALVAAGAAIILAALPAVAYADTAGMGTYSVYVVVIPVVVIVVVILGIVFLLRYARRNRDRRP